MKRPDKEISVISSCVCNLQTGLDKYLHLSLGNAFAMPNVVKSASASVHFYPHLIFYGKNKASKGLINELR